MRRGSADPLARGAYTVAPVEAAGMRAAYGAPIDDRLFFAGDSAPGAHALTVTGARRSGEAAADAILAVPA